MRMEERQRDMIYVTTVPRMLKSWWTLAHNYVRHTVEMDIGRNGFRAWWFKTVPDNFKSCACGWSGLPAALAQNINVSRKK
jgi:hypothetical protein